MSEAEGAWLGWRGGPGPLSRGCHPPGGGSGWPTGHRCAPALPEPGGLLFAAVPLARAGHMAEACAQGWEESCRSWDLQPGIQHDEWGTSWPFWGLTSSSLLPEFTMTVKETYCSVRNLAPNTQYEFWVTAENRAGVSPASERVVYMTGEAAAHPRQGLPARAPGARPSSWGGVWVSSGWMEGAVYFYFPFYFTHPIHMPHTAGTLPPSWCPMSETAARGHRPA